MFLTGNWKTMGRILKAIEKDGGNDGPWFCCRRDWAKWAITFDYSTDLLGG